MSRSGEELSHVYGRLGWRFLHHESVDARGGPADHTVDTAPLAVDLCISFSNAHAECVDYKLYSRASIRHDHVGRKFDFFPTRLERGERGE